MKRRTWALLIAVAGLLAGCVVTSVYPFYTAKDLAYRPDLLGTWTKDSEQWKFERDGDQAYQLTYSEDGKASVMKAHLFQLRGKLFLDLYPAKDYDLDTCLQPIPSHLVMRVKQLEPTLTLATLSYDWLQEFLQKNPKAIRYIMVNPDGKTDKGRIVLTASTADLQRFLLKHLNTPGAWDDFELKR
jgi:hypothetical protein